MISSVFAPFSLPLVSHHWCAGVLNGAAVLPEAPFVFFRFFPFCSSAYTIATKLSSCSLILSPVSSALLCSPSSGFLKNFRYCIFQLQNFPLVLFEIISISLLIVFI